MGRTSNLKTRKSGDLPISLNTSSRKGKFEYIREGYLVLFSESVFSALFPCGRVIFFAEISKGEEKLEQQIKKWGLLSFLLAFVMAVLVACGSPAKDDAKKPEENTDQAAGQQEEQQEEEVAAFPVTFTDDAGREVTIEKEPESIVSIQTSNTEILFALGVGDKVIGVSDYCNYPEAVNDIQKVGAQDMDAELILQLLPDVAFVTTYHYENHATILEQFEEAGITVVVTGSAASFDEAYDTMKMIATATGSVEESEKIVTSMKERLEEIKEKAKQVTDQKRVWVEVSPGPDIFTTGKGTFMNEMLESIHAINVASDHEGWVKLTEEEIVQLNPDVIVTTYGYYVDDPVAEVLGRDGWAEVPAVKNDFIFDVDSDTVTRPGPRLIEGVETLAKRIYPEVFGE